ncbi:MAG: glycoside hydrolase family 28 protein [Phycisphaerae bacterium]
MPHRTTKLTPLFAATLLAAASSAFAATKTIDVTTAGIKNDGTTLNTTALQKLIDDSSAAGGATLHFPPGKYLTGTLQLKSNITLHLDENATLLGSTNPADYRNLDPFTDGSGNPMGYALLIALDADHIAIEGPGSIDGQGPSLKRNEKPKYTLRPFLLRWIRCHDISLQDAHLANPGAWTCHFFQSRDIDVSNLTIRTRNIGLQNADGLDIDSSENIRITRCDINTGDDALVLKSTSPLPTQHFTASDCKLSSHTNAIKLGTESLGGFNDITVSNCTVSNTDMAGIALYTVDGGDLQNVHLSHIDIDGAAVPISIRLGARLKTFRPGDQPKPVGHLRDITLDNISAKNIKLIGMLINGIPDHPIQNLTLSNISLQLPGGGKPEDANKQLPEKESTYPEYNMFGKSLPAACIYARHIDNLTLQNIHATLEHPDPRPAAVLIDIQNLTPKDFTLTAETPQGNP